MPKSGFCLGKFISPGKREGRVSRRGERPIPIELNAGLGGVAGRADEAAELARRAASAHRSGDLVEAAKFYRRALRRAEGPDGDFDFTRLSIALARVLAGQGKHDEAERTLRAAVARDPTHAVAHENHAAALRDLGRLADAERACRRALAIDDVFVAGFHTLGTILAALGRTDDAEAAFNRAVSLDPRHVSSLIALAALSARRDRHDTASDLLERAVSVAPQSAEAHLKLGILRAERGEGAAAVASLRAALEHDPNHVEAWYALSLSGALDLGRGDTERLVRLAASDGVDEDQKIKLSFVLGNAAERQGKIARAFADFQHGNSLRKAALARAGRRFDPDAHAGKVRAVIDAYPLDRFADLGPSAEPGPIFIAGAPRAGATLVRRILAAHPEAARLLSATPIDTRDLGRVARETPGARIIHCRRDLHDTGLSCFTHNFESPQAWSCDLDHIGAYLAGARALVAHWRGVLPPHVMIEMDYESLVANGEATIRRMIAFLGLDWSPSCLAFQKAPGVVHGAAKWQVRRPIYAASVGRWRAYREFLGPLIERLR